MSVIDSNSATALPDEAAAAGAGHGRVHLPFAKVLHWSVVVLVMFLVVSGIVMKQLGEGPVSMQLYTLHKSAGALALVLIVIRLVYRLWTTATGRWHKGSGANKVHLILYGAMLAVPLLGWAGVSDFGARGIVFGYELPKIWPEGAGHADLLFAAHAYLAFALLALVVIHIGIAVEDYVMRGARAARPPAA